MKAIFPLLNLFVVISTSAQSYQITYRNPKDSTVNYYLTVRPIGPPKGLLVLLPGFGEMPESVYAETDLPKEAARQGMLTVIATLQQGGQSFYIDDLSQKTLDSLIREVQNRYKLTGKKLYVGGFSLGGSGTVRYAERAAATNGPSRPDAVFAIDPPLDFKRLYESMSKVKHRSKSEVAVSEATFFTERMQQEFGGTPTSQMQQYLSLSPFCYTDTTNQNANLLLNMPIRIISEPAIGWQMEERNRDLYDQNTLDCVALINYLRLSGNKNAIYIQTVGKGYRKQPKSRHPHSWSIADPKNTIHWLLKL